MAKLTGKELVQKSRIRIMSMPEWRWLSGIAMMGEVKFVSGDHRVETAATDGVNEIYNTDWMEQLSPDEALYVVLHENMHKMLRHWTTTKWMHQENALIAAIATDAVINNQWLEGKAGIKMPSIGGVNMPEYADASKWSAEKIFRDLQRRFPNAKPNGGQGLPEGWDEHDYDTIDSMTPEQQQHIQRQVDMALRQAAMAGTLNGGMPRSVQEMLVPEVDWRSELAEFVKTVCAGFDNQTWVKPHRTYIAHDLYMPSPFSEAIGRVLIAGDTSGSIGGETMSLFVGHMQHLVNEVQPDGVDIAWWDTNVAGVDCFDKGNMGNLASSVRPAGGGGTDPSCLTPWRKDNKKEYVCAVVITDGYFGSDIGDWSDLPVLWLVVGDADVNHIKQGRVIQVKELR